MPTKNEPRTIADPEGTNTEQRKVSPANARTPNTDETWDLIIQPRDSLLHLHLDDLWRYRDLIYLFVRRDFVAQFKQTILGPAWFVIQPLLTTVMFTIVFGTIAKLSTDSLPKILFYLSGNIMWQYFSTCLTLTSSTFTSNAGLFGKVYFPRLVVPISVVISAFLKFTLQFAIFMVFWTHYKISGSPIHFTFYCLLFPVLIFLMAGLSLGLGIIFSSMTTKYRDLRFLLEFGVQLVMYVTPVIYPLSSITSKWKWIVLANPMTAIIETFRYGFLGTGTFSWTYLLYSFIFMVVVIFLGIIIFNRVEKTFMDTV